MDFRSLIPLLFLLANAWGQSAGLADTDRSSERVVFFSGEVMLDNGSGPPDAVLIQRVCDGRAHFETWTDAKGQFSFKVDTSSGDPTASDATQPAGQAADLNKAINRSSTQYSNPITSALRNCELQAILPGFQSENVTLNVKSTLDGGRLGTIILHPLSRASALTVSATTLLAPSSARRAYEKGLEALARHQWDTAGQEFTKAVKAFPKFAAAWHELGRVRQSRNDIPGAVEAWKEALKQDPKYVKPYESLTAAADQREDWAASEKYSHDWLQLDPEDFPAAYLFNAIANARLNRMGESERAAREGLRIDKGQKVPRLNYVLGLILMQKREYSESARCFRTYLELAPNARDAATVRQELSKIEQAAATSPPK